MIKINYINQYNKNLKYKSIITSIIKLGYKHLNLTEKYIISVVLIDNQKIQELNRDFRNIDKPTDVLSFENYGDPYEIGDVFISIDKVQEQAEDLKHSFKYELAFIALHGFLHCLGYDHITDEDNIEMNKIQDIIISKSKYQR